MAKSYLKKLATKFRRDDRGNVAMIAALSVIPIVSVVGLAIDLQMTSTQQAGVLAAVDSAVIAGAKSLQAGRTKKQIEQEVNDYVSALIKDKSRGTSCNRVILNFGNNDETINASVSCTQKTTLSHMFGRETMSFKIESGSAYGVGDVEVAMVFDVSGSMNSANRMKSLKQAANNAVDILLPKDKNTGEVQSEGIRISMISYDTMMNAGIYFKKVTGLDAKRTITVPYQTCKKWKWEKKNGKWKKYCDRYEDGEKTYNVDSTCVSERTGDDAFTDEEPAEDKWITPVEVKVKKKKNGTPKGISVETCNEFGPQPLTNNRQKLEKYIKDIEPRGGTAGQLGIAWGWYTLSPKWNDVWPSASEAEEYDPVKNTKVIIMMTDGEFNTAFDYSLGDSSEQAIAMCDEIKLEGVLIYTVAFQAPQKGKQTLKSCATSDEYAFEPKNASELNDAYADIARSISDLRISH